VEAEYIGASDAAKEAIWVHSLYARILYGKILYKYAEQCPHCLCSDNDSKATEPQQIFVDNQGAIQLAKCYTGILQVGAYSGTYRREIRILKERYVPGEDTYR